MRSRSRASRWPHRALVGARLPVAAALIACVLGILVTGPAQAAPAPGTQHAHKHLAHLQVSPAVPTPTDSHRSPSVPDTLPGDSQVTDPLVAGAASPAADAGSVALATAATRGRGPPRDV